MLDRKKIGLGGGCHWCTEAIFQSLKGVQEVEQGYIASTGEASDFSEAVLITYWPEVIPLEVLIEIHLHTHESTSQHSFRQKYRSAVYTTSGEDQKQAREIVAILQEDFQAPLVTEVLPFREFKSSRESLHNYYFTDPNRPFCRRYIEPKLRLLLENFAGRLREGRGGILS